MKSKPVEPQFINLRQKSQSKMSLKSLFTSISLGMSRLILTSLSYLLVMIELKQKVESSYIRGCNLQTCILILQTIARLSSTLNYFFDLSRKASIKPVKSYSSKLVKLILIRLASYRQGKDLSLVFINQVISVIELVYNNQSYMKNHQRQISQQLKLHRTNISDTSPYKLQAFKNFKKKHLMHEQPSTSSSSNIAKNLISEKRLQNKNSPLRYNSKNKSQRKRSFQKFTINTRTAERASLNMHSLKQTNLSTKSKLIKITNILCQNVFGGNKKMLTQLFKGQDQYQKLVRQWQSLQLFDQVDKLIQRIITYYGKVIEDLVLQTSHNLNEKLLKMQQTIQKLAMENVKVKNELSIYSHLNEVLLPIKHKLLTEYEKNQWNTFVFNSLSLSPFNFEDFIRQTPVYKRWVEPYFQVMGSNLYKNTQALEQDSFIQKGQIQKTRLKSKSAQNCLAFSANEFNS